MVMLSFPPLYFPKFHYIGEFFTNVHSFNLFFLINDSILMCYLPYHLFLQHCVVSVY